MKARVDAHSTGLDKLKWLVVIVLAVAAVLGNSYFSDAALLYRVAGVLLVSAVAFFVFLQTAKGRQLLVLAREARTELRKVVWPTRPETTQTTVIVLIAVTVVALLLWLIDSFLSWVIRSLIY